MKAIIIEDEIRIREGINKLMGKLFPEITVEAMAENGLDGLAYMEYYKPDLVITDIRMPGMDGLEMLSKARSLGLSPNVIVLTAYSEFAYAQQAVRLGVQDYLVKPIVVQEFTQTIRRVQALWEQEQKRAPETVGSLENIVSQLLHGAHELGPDTETFLEKRYGLRCGEPMLLLPVYLGDGFSSRRQRVRQELEGLLRQWDGLRYCLVDIEYDRTVIALAYGYSSRERFEAWYANRAGRQGGMGGEDAVCGIMEISGLYGIREDCQTVMSCLDWAIPLGNDALIRCPQCTQTQTEVCVYPIELENQMKSALCSGEGLRLQKSAERFRDYFKRNVYAPGEIKDSYVRFLWAVLNVAKEIGSMDGQGIDQRDILDRVMGAKTAMELYRPFDELLGRIQAGHAQAAEICLAVRRALSMIHEFYADGITLGEIADRLNMSQEYLGTQFHKELREPFSIYIRNVRMAKAKELLIGTQLKQYEIARRVGYADSKYFARVFRECEGMSPAEYRRASR